jgi:hypothetical protein
MRSRFVKLSLVFFLLLPYMALAQQTGTIVGTVTDSSGAVVPEAAVSLINTATDFHRTVTTNSSGQFTAASLPAGSYTLSIEKAGFQRLERSNITLASAATANIDLTLTVGSNSETITVSESTSLIPCAADSWSAYGFGCQPGGGRQCLCHSRRCQLQREWFNRCC